MFIRAKKIKSGEGYKTYYYIVKNVKAGNKHKLVNVLYLGSAERLYNLLKNIKSKARNYT